MGLLSDPELGPAAADGFSLLMSNCTDVMTRAGHAEVRLMFRQRFFTDNVPALVQGFQAAPQGEESLKGPKYIDLSFARAKFSKIIEILSAS